MIFFVTIQIILIAFAQKKTNDFFCYNSDNPLLHFYGSGTGVTVLRLNPNHDEHKMMGVAFHEASHIALDHCDKSAELKAELKAVKNMLDSGYLKEAKEHFNAIKKRSQLLTKQHEMEAELNTVDKMMDAGHLTESKEYMDFKVPNYYFLLAVLSKILDCIFRSEEPCVPELRYYLGKFHKAKKLSLQGKSESPSVQEYAEHYIKHRRTKS